VRREQRVLHRVGGFLAVADGADRDCPKPVAVAPDQLGERLRVAVDVGAQQLGVARLGRTPAGVVARVAGCHASNLAEKADRPSSGQDP
jgi:hypothetical protein